MITRITTLRKPQRVNRVEFHLPLAFIEMEMELAWPFSEAFPRLLFFHGPLDIANNFIFFLFNARSLGSCITQQDVLTLSPNPLPSIRPRR